MGNFCQFIVNLLDSAFSTHVHAQCATGVTACWASKRSHDHTSLVATVNLALHQGDYVVHIPTSFDAFQLFLAESVKYSIL